MKYDEDEWGFYDENGDYYEYDWGLQEGVNNSQAAVEGVGGVDDLKTNTNDADAAGAGSAESKAKPMPKMKKRVKKKKKDDPEEDAGDIAVDGED